MAKIIALAALLSLACASSQRINSATPSNIPGVANFAEVTPHLCRGARPTAQGFRSLRALGVQVDVDLEAGSEPENERPLAEAAGLRFVSFPWHAWPFVFPVNSRVVSEFLALVRAHPGTVFFVHCRQGSDRTGVSVAAFRLENGFPQRAALNELARFHFHWYLFPLWSEWLEREK